MDSPPAVWLRTLRTVGAAMIGVRSRADHQHDGHDLSPLLLVAVAIVFMLLFVGVLVTVASGVSGR